MANTQTRTIEWTTQALDTLDHMAGRLGELRSIFGENSPHYLKASESFAAVMLQLVRLGGRVMSDGDLSLIADTQVGIVVGVVWHRKRVESTGVEGTDTLPIPEEYQLAGEWSTHS